MAGLRIHLEESDAGAVTVHLEGTLDAGTAAELRKSLDTLGSRDLVLDFSHVRDFMDLAVGVLSQSLEQRRVELRGLQSHPERMFRYFGVGSAAAAPERAYYKPEELLAS